MKKFAIFGASGFGREVLPIARQQLATEDAPWELVFVDDNPQTTEQNGHRVLTYAEWLTEPATSRHITIAIANSSIREKLVQRCESDHVEFFSVRASNVVLLDEIQIKHGAILMPFSCLSSNIKIGKHFHVNYYSYVAHDCVIGDYVTFAPGVKCNGNVVIEDHAYIGAGAILKQGKPGAPIIIGRAAVIGMGAVVTKSVPPGVTVIGNPAKPMAK